MTVLLVGERAPAEAPSSVRSAERMAAAGPTDRSWPSRPGGLALGADGSTYVSEPAAGRVWRFGRAGGPAVVTSPRAAVPAVDQRGMLTPAGLALGPDGTLFVADTSGHRLWALSPTGGCHVVAGGACGYRDGPSEQALFRFPSDVAVGPDGTCYVADTGNDRIRTVAPDGLVRTLAGSIYDYGDGQGPNGRFRHPLALDVDDAGDCYVADTGNNAVRRVAGDGEVTTVAGSPPGGEDDGTGERVGLRWPSGIAAGPGRSLWVADHGNGALRRIEDSVSTTPLRLGDGRWPVAVAVGPLGMVTVAAAMSVEGGDLLTVLVTASTS